MRFLRWRMTSFYFNSRPSARGDYIDWLVEFCVINISIHAPPRGATGETAEMPRTIKISIHAPPRGATSSATVLASGVLFQFTPLREGRQHCGINCPVLPFISIHAPPRGATNTANQNYSKLLISIHAPPRGATPSQSPIPADARHFNSRPSARGDSTASGVPVISGVFQFTPLREGRQPDTIRQKEASHISIHAPPRGATATANALKRTNVFQFTPLREGRPAPRRSRTRPSNFNSRPSARGDRRRKCRAGTVYSHFNSRPSARGDIRQVLHHARAVYFNSRPSARGDPADLQRRFALCISIHAPPRGATARCVRKTSPTQYFNSRPSARGDEHALHNGNADEIFQFTPLREGRPVRTSACEWFRGISIHAPPRGATNQERTGSPCINFNSRPSARGDPAGKEQREVCVNFNSRPSARGDYFCCISKQHIVISIHAPPRGATRMLRMLQCSETNFNSRPSARGDITGGFVTDDDGTFQFTPLREGRRIWVL